jgi:hypothetical protein
MSFTKSEMQEELFNFLSRFGKDVASLYGCCESTLTEVEFIKKSPIWVVASEMYDYGVMGIPSETLHPEGHIEGVYGHIERFLCAMDTPQMRLYLEASNNAPPRLSLLAVQSAVARMVLDGGWRHTDYGASEYGALKGDMNQLTLAEIALLANMDERSVRNAANPKLPDPLKTVQVGKRSLVSPTEARRWLAGRKGYIPSRTYTGTRRYSVDITLPVLPEEFLDQIQRVAAESGFSAQKILEEHLLANIAAAFKEANSK